MQFMQKELNKEMKKIVIVVGTRPNLVKITQFKKEVQKFENLELKLVHTGQHSNAKMSDVFLEQFQIEIDYFLGITANTPNQLIGEIITKLEGVLLEYQPDLVLCVGDVNSTLATAICTNKLQIKLGHIESGLRSNDRLMPEEINRILTDEITDICFVTEQSGLINLLESGKKQEEIEFVGNTMIDTLVAFQTKIDDSNVLIENQLEPESYFLVTLHRPSNVDTKENLLRVINLLKAISKVKKVVFPIHPRTQNNLKKFNLYNQFLEIENIIILSPQDYFSFQKLIKHSFCVITDSGGIQEETTFQQIPCITLRENTERPSTLIEGTNVLLKFDEDAVLKSVKTIGEGTFKKGTIPKLWDGKATVRILEKCNQFLS